MEMEMNVVARQLLSLIMILLLPLLAIWLKIIARRRPKVVLNLPPSPPKLPIIGNIHQLGKLPHRSLRDLSRKYGPLLLMQLGHNPTLVVSSAELARELVKDHDVVFSNRPQNTAVHMLLYGCKDLSFATYGEYWRQVRKISVVQLLSVRRVHSFQFVRGEEVDILINQIRIASLKRESINLTEMLMAVTNNMVGRCVLSRRTEEDGSNKYGQLMRRVMVLISSLCVRDMFPYLKWLDFVTGFIPSLKAVSRELDAFLDQVIEEHQLLKCDDQVTDFKKDFVSIILQLQKDGMLELELTQDNIKAILLDMIVGGSDSVSTTMDWLMAELIKHPNVMKKVQEEVRNVVGNNKYSKVELADTNKMAYLKCVIKETFRLHGGPLIARETCASTKLGGYDIPSNIRVLINIFAIHTDPNWWEKPEEFIPERFENSSIDFKSSEDFQFIPFGCGRRSCPAMSFGVASIGYVIANLLYFFDWKLPISGQIVDNLDMTELVGIALYKKVPLHVIPISHFPN